MTEPTPAETLAAINPEWSRAFQPVRHAAGAVLARWGRANHVLLVLEDGFVTLRGEGGPALGFLGRGGILGTHGLMDADARVPFGAFAETEVRGQAVDAQVARLICAACERSRRIVERANQSLVVGLSAMLSLAGEHRSEGRTAYWLLQASSHLGDTLEATHIRIADTMGSRRPSVTGDLNRFLKAGLIGKSRGRIEILDAAALAEVAGNPWAAVARDRCPAAPAHANA